MVFQISELRIQHVRTPCEVRLNCLWLAGIAVQMYANQFPLSLGELRSRKQAEPMGCSLLYVTRAKSV